MKILVTGANGQLGSEIQFISPRYNYEFQFIDLHELDLTELDEIVPYLSKHKPDFIINCAAYTAVDKAEDDFDLCKKINALAPAAIVEYCANGGCRLIHISTDYVFNGDFDRPISEDDKPNPQSVYGQTKLAGENSVLDTLKSTYVIRTSWVYSEFGNNFVKTMLRLGKDKDEIGVVADQYGSPTWARDLAEAVLKIIDEIQHDNDRPGVYHYSNEGAISWFDFASEVIKVADFKCKVNPITTAQFPTKAIRPKYSVLDKSKIAATFKVNIPIWVDSLNKYLMKIQ